MYISALEKGSIPFTDVTSTKTTNAVLWAYNHKITTGTSSTTFSPYCTGMTLRSALK